jgi:hypothetical protein
VHASMRGTRKSAELSEHLDSIGGVKGGDGSGPTAGLIFPSFSPFTVQNFLTWG